MSRATRTPAPDHRRSVLVLAALMVGLFLSELDQTVFATALPTLAGDLDGVDRLAWVNTAYLLTGALAMPVHGKLGDLLGRKPVFVGALLVFLAGSVLGGLAPDLGTLVTARAVQGLGGGGLLVGVQAIVADLVAPRERARVLSVVGAVFAGSAVLGPVLGGWFADGPGWRWLFWLNLPLGGLAVLGAACFLDLGRPGSRDGTPVRVDVAGIATLSCALSAVVLLAGLGSPTRWVSPAGLLLAAVAAAAGVGFVVVERRAVEPLVPLDLFRVRAFTVPTVAAAVLAVAVFGAIGYLPTYLQMVVGLSPRLAGLAMLALVGGLGGATVIAGQVVARTGRQRPLPVAGGVLVAVALTGLALAPTAPALRLVLGWLFVLGVGTGAGLQVVVVMAQNAAPARQLGAATAAVSFVREVGVVVGTAAVGGLLTARLAARLRHSPVVGIDPASLTPGILAGLPAPVRAQVATTYAEALAPVLGWLVPLVVLSTIALALVRPAPLVGPGPLDPSRPGTRPVSV